MCVNSSAHNEGAYKALLTIRFFVYMDGKNFKNL